MTDKSKIVIARAFGKQKVRIVLSLKPSLISAGTISVQAATEISTQEAREIAAALIFEADRADAIAAKKATAELRRQKWRQREIDAGRLKIMSADDFFRRRT